MSPQLTPAMIGKTSDDSLFALMYTLDDDDDFTDPSVWIKSKAKKLLT